MSSKSRKCHPNLSMNRKPGPWSRKRPRYKLSLNRNKRKRLHAGPDMSTCQAPDSEQYLPSDSGASHIEPDSHDNQSDYSLLSRSPLPHAKCQEESFCTPGNNTWNTETANAPKKNHFRKASKRRCLFKDKSHLLQCHQKILEVLPDVLQKLSDLKLLTDFTQFFELVAAGDYPLSCIALTCFLDTVKWYSCESTSRMVYRPETKQFWRVVYKILHGNAIRLFSGIKSLGQVLNGEATRGDINPKNSMINFAVPDMSNIVCSEDVGVPKEVPPGIIHEALRMKAKSPCSMILSVDGKKLAQGLSDNGGDQDLFGHEVPNLESAKKRIMNELTCLDNLEEKCILYGTGTSDDANGLVSSFSETVLSMSLRIKELRHVFVGQTFNLKKFFKAAGEDWRNSKYLHAISSVQAQLHQIKVCVDSLVQINGRLLLLSASFQKDCPVPSTPETTPNITWLPEVSMSDESAIEPRLVKQRTELWHNLRSCFPVTGSTIHRALGLDTLKKQREHVRKIRGESVPEIVQPDVQVKMDHGVKHEPDAVVTLGSYVLPHFYPNSQFLEEGCRVIIEDGVKILVSPDGSLCAKGEVHQFAEEVSGGIVEYLPKATMACEIKCPYPGDFKTPVQYSLPNYYVTQLLAEMACMNVDQALFVSYSTESTAVHVVTFDAELWEEVVAEVRKVYGSNPVLPSSLSPESKKIKEKIRTFSESHVRFLCEVPSLTVATVPDLESVGKQDIGNVFTVARTAIKEAYQLSRRKASEVLVWLLSDTDRLWQAEIPHSIPVAYAMKGYSLTADTMRDMCSDILNTCKEKDIHIACTTFDGQWLKLAIRSSKQEPLTLLQLQVDVWRSVCALSREQLVAVLSSVTICGTTAKKTNHGLVLTCPLFDQVNKIIGRKYSDGPQQIDEINPEIVHQSGLQNLEQLPVQALEVIDTLGIDTHAQQPEITLLPPGEQHKEHKRYPNESVITHQTKEHAGHKLTVDELCVILNQLKSHGKPAVSSVWQAKTVEDLGEILSSAASLYKLRVSELDVIICHTKSHQVQQGLNIKISGWTKTEKVNALSTILGNGSEIYFEMFVDQVYDLRTLAANVLAGPVKAARMASKHMLNIICAHAIYPHERRKWEEACTVKNIKIVDEHGQFSWKPEFWFSYPEFNESRGMLEPKCCDSHHLFVNCRVKVCKDGLVGFGVSNQAWVDVAEKHPNVISKCLVVDILDKQSNAFAQKTFSEEVETTMRSLGHEEEARFCQLIRHWYMAEDEPGIPAVQRTKMRIALRSYLLSKVNLATFPPCGSHVASMPRQMFEGLLQSIDTHIQLHGIIKSGAYGPRAVTSLVNETFFGEMTEHEQTSLGCPKATQIPRLISSVTELMHYRHNPENRTFAMRLMNRTVYQADKCDGVLSPPEETDQQVGCGQTYDICKEAITSDIIIRDHFFDRSERRRVKRRTAKATDVGTLTGVMTGERGVREHHRPVKSLILKTDILGIKLLEPH